MSSFKIYNKIMNFIMAKLEKTHLNITCLYNKTLNITNRNFDDSWNNVS